jgi:hypothetical protein
MPAKKISVKKTISSDWKYSVRLGEDKVKASGTYKDEFAGWGSRCPDLGSVHPDIQGMYLVAIDANREEGGLIKVDLSYESSDGTANRPGRGEDPEAQKRYAIELNAGEEHILTADIYGDNLVPLELKALLAISNGTEDKADGAAYADDVLTELGLAALAKIRKGTVARKSSSVTWVEKSVTDDLVDVEFLKFDTIQTPPGLPNPEADKWIYRGTPAIETAEGGFYELEKRWEYAPFGWDLDLYSEPE